MLTLINDWKCLSNYHSVVLGTFAFIVLCVGGLEEENAHGFVFLLVGIQCNVNQIMIFYVETLLFDAIDAYSGLQCCLDFFLSLLFIIVRR